MIAVVGAVIENGAGEILLAQRPPGKYLAGMWEFPGGKVESGESNEAAILRELQEELQLDVRIVKYLGSFPHSYPEHAIELRMFLVRALGTPHITADVQHFRWVRAASIPHSELAPADLAPLAAYLAQSPLD